MYVILPLNPSAAPLYRGVDGPLARSLAPPRLITPCPLTGNTRISRKFTGRRNVRRHIAIRATNRKLYLGAAAEAGSYVEGFLRTTFVFSFTVRAGIVREEKTNA